MGIDIKISGIARWAAVIGTATAVVMAASMPAQASTPSASDGTTASGLRVASASIQRAADGTASVDAIVLTGGPAGAGGVCEDQTRWCGLYLYGTPDDGTTLVSVTSADLRSSNYSGDLSLSVTDLHAAHLSAVSAKIDGAGGTVRSEWFEVEDSYPTTQTLSLSDIHTARNADGTLHYDVKANLAGHMSPAGTCSWTGNPWVDNACILYLEATGDGTTVVNLTQAQNARGAGDPGTINFTGDIRTARLTALRLRLWVNGSAMPEVITDWVPISDSYPTSTTVGITNFDQHRTAKGTLSWSVDAHLEGFSQGNAICGSWERGCGLDVQFITKDGKNTILTVGGKELARAGVGDSPMDPNDVHLAGESTVTKIAAIRVVLGNSVGTIASAWTPLSDPYPATSRITTKVKTVTRDGASTRFDIKAKGAGVWGDGRACEGSSRCSVAAEGHVAGTNDWINLAFETVEYGSDPVSVRLSGTANGQNLDQVRTSFGQWYDGHGPWSYSPAVPISGNVVDGHDLDAAADLAVTAMAASAAPCIELFPVGSRFNGSSVNDQQIACLSATRNGTTLRAFVLQFLRSATAKEVAMFLANAGIQSAEYAASHGGARSTDPVPSTCKAFLGGMACGDFPDGAFTWKPFVDAPPAQDPTWSGNQAYDDEGDDAPLTSPAGDGGDSPEEQMPKPIPAPVPAAPKSSRDLVMRQCVADAYQLGADPDDCETANIFATGTYNGTPSEATQHDLDAITENPERFELTYVTGTEKSADARRTWLDPFRSSSCPPAAEKECDEYPYYTTEQGADTFVNADGSPGTTVSLRMIDKKHNSSQGGYLSAFVRQCGLGSFPRRAEGRKYLVVPMQSLPTTWICGSKE